MEISNTPQQNVDVDRDNEVAGKHFGKETTTQETETFISTTRQLTNKNKEDLCRLDIPYPHVTYPINSRRDVCELKLGQDRIYKFLNSLVGWSNYKYISIDGMNGTGKSTLCSKMVRTYTKVNKRHPFLTKNNTHNFKPDMSMHYLILNVDFIDLCQDQDEYFVGDRSPISNIAYLIVQHLMCAFQDKDFPLTMDYDVISILNNFTMNTGLLKVISMIRYAMKGAMFIICSDIEYITQIMAKRGSDTNTLSDLLYCSKFNYQQAQVFAFKYLAGIMNVPILDLKDVFDNNISLNVMFNSIIKKVDNQSHTILINRSNNNESTNECCSITIDDSAESELCDLLSTMSLNMMLLYSRK